jgi:hypothetical protein
MALDFPPSPTPNELYYAAGKVWRWNGKAWEAYTPFGFGATGGFGIKGTTAEVEVSLSGLTYLVGLPNDVEVSNSLTTQYLNLNGNTFAGGAGGVTLSSRMSVIGDINITGTLVVDGPIVSKTGFSGYTLDGDVEAITDVSLDGGEF